ncbi:MULTISPECIES: PH domain-containing protein [Trueperella]|uniref:Membrane protein YdbS with pleckstrin-like domain n=1 Tax=Trueperella abortisuis TaxID=445930 RepID=A0ABT9PK97_9ACTO|nr:MULTISPECIES: PH domain-containing protein [Trueperella]MCI7305771.1 PH domain-containing protein [Trueperella sp.]MDP9833149.1 membrane protein YdbS with pleckstrin-like domain [Trueperella abortisuis]MDY5403482.1 PH domain-containing protein [Trueperella sp.]
MRNPLAKDVEFTPLDPGYIKVQAIRWSTGVLAAVAVGAIPAFTLGNASFPAVLWWASFAVWALVWIIQIPFALRRARAFGYAELEDELLIRSGIMFHGVTVVPYGRMQQVEVGTGPLLKRYGLAKIELVTASAGSNASIPGLALAEAERLREKLTALGEARMEGL